MASRSLQRTSICRHCNRYCAYNILKYLSSPHFSIAESGVKHQKSNHQIKSNGNQISYCLGCPIPPLFLYNSPTFLNIFFLISICMNYLSLNNQYEIISKISCIFDNLIDIYMFYGISHNSYYISDKKKPLISRAGLSYRLV